MVVTSFTYLLSFVQIINGTFLFSLCSYELYITNNATHANNIIDISNEIINYDLIKEIEEKANNELSY